MNSLINSLSREQKDALIAEAVDAGIREYLSQRRDKVDSFVDAHFDFKGAWKLNRKAFGYDILRAPANLAWTPVQFLLKGAGKGAAKVGWQGFSDKMDALPTGIRTDIERQVEWLTYSEFLELPLEQEQRTCEKNALLECILAQPQLRPVFAESLEKLAALASDEAGKASLTDNLARYVDSRKVAAELSAIVVGAAAGYSANQSFNLGAMGLGNTLATTLAYHSAVSSFAMGNTLGGLYYAVVPVTVSKTALVLSTGGAAAVLGMVAAFAGVVADPLQKHLGLHHKKLHRLVDCLEVQLKEGDEQTLPAREAYIARVLDISDIFMTLAAAR